jgi:hypothetical protein
MNRMTWLDDYKDIIVCLYNEGVKQTEIAEEFEVSQTAISLRLRKWGVSNPDKNRFKRIEIDKDTLYDLYWNKEMHPGQIGEKFGCTKMAITKKMQKHGIPFRTKSEARRGKLNPIHNVGHTKETRKKMSDAFVNGTRSNFGFSGNWGSVQLYKSPNQGMIKMRSSWEAKTADYLTENKVNWYYESKWLKLDGINYLPDFYLPDFNLFIEVKGRKKDTDLVKMKLAKKYKHKILLWDGEELLKRGIIDNSGFSEINKKYTGKERYIDNWDIYKNN